MHFVLEEAGGSLMGPSPGSMVDGTTQFDPVL